MIQILLQRDRTIAYSSRTNMLSNSTPGNIIVDMWEWVPFLPAQVVDVCKTILTSYQMIAVECILLLIKSVGKNQFTPPIFKKRKMKGKLNTKLFRELTFATSFLSCFFTPLHVQIASNILVWFICISYRLLCIHLDRMSIATWKSYFCFSTSNLKWTS